MSQTEISIKETMPEFFLSKDLKQAAKTMTRDEARFVVDYYYTIQEHRKAQNNQVGALAKGKEPHQLITWLAQGSHKLEDQIKRALEVYTDNDPVGQWSKSIVGVGPVIAAGLLAYIDIEQAPTFGHILRFAGMDPTIEWLGKEKATKLVNEHVKGSKLLMDELVAISTLTNRKVDRLQAQLKDEFTKANLIKVLSRRPWNNNLKTLCWKIGESFVKTYGVKGAQYGKVYLSRRAYEEAKNQNGDYADQARMKLEKFKIGKDTEAYKWYSGCYLGEAAKNALAIDEQSERLKFLRGSELKPGEGTFMLPPAHLHARAKRYAVRLFISHWHQVAYETRFQRPVPLPFAIEHLGHADVIKPPNYDPITK